MAKEYEEFTTIGEVRREIRNIPPLSYCLMLNFRNFKGDLKVDEKTFKYTIMAACDDDSVNAYLENGTLYLHTR